MFGSDVFQPIEIHRFLGCFYIFFFCEILDSVNQESRGRSHHGDFEVGDLLPQRHGALGRDLGQCLWGADGANHQAELNKQFPT